MNTDPFGWLLALMFAAAAFTISAEGLGEAAARLMNAYDAARVAR